VTASDPRWRSLAIGIAWTYGLSGMAVLCQVCLVAYASRVLTPADYAAYALAFMLVQFCSLFARSGIPQAVMREQNLSPASQRSVVGAANAGLAISIAAILVLALASHMAWRAASPLRLSLVLIPSVVANTWAAPRLAILRVQSRHRAASLVECGGQCLGFAFTGVALANGLEVWSLPLGYVLGALLQLTSAARLVDLPWFAGLRSVGADGWQVARFTANVSGQNLCHFMLIMSPMWLGAFVYTPAQIGELARASQLANMLLDQVVFGMGRILYPRFGKARSDKAQIRAITHTAMYLLLAISLCFLIAGVLCDVPIGLFLGSNWRGVPTLLRISLGIAALRLLYTCLTSLAEALDLMSLVWWQLAAQGLIVTMGYALLLQATPSIYWLFAPLGLAVIAGLAIVSFGLLRAHFLSRRTLSHTLVGISSLALFSTTSLVLNLNH
jgi:O-antigen/teichoic acid export membrane protein